MQIPEHLVQVSRRVLHRKTHVSIERRRVLPSHALVARARIPVREVILQKVFELELVWRGRQFQVRLPRDRRVHGVLGCPRLSRSFFR